MAGFGDLDVMQRARRLTVGVVMLALGGVVGYALPQSNASPSSEIGSITSVGNTTTGRWPALLLHAGQGQVGALRLQDATPWQKTSHPDAGYPKGQPSLPGSRVDHAGQGDARHRHRAGGRIGAWRAHCRLGGVLRLTSLATLAADQGPGRLICAAPGITA